MEQRVPAVPARSRESIERAADRFLARYCPEAREDIMVVPIDRIVEIDVPRECHDVIFRLAELPPPLEGNTDPLCTPGLIELQFPPDVYEKLKNGNCRARFTAAHELGHLELGHADQIPHAIAHGYFTGLARRSELRPFEDPEWQANYFAACVLMNRDIMRRIVAKHGRSATVVAEQLQVSVPAASRRLIYLFGPVK